MSINRRDVVTASLASAAAVGLSAKDAASAEADSPAERDPLMETQQDGSIRIIDLTKVVMDRSRFGLPKERLVPFEAAWNVSDADDRPCALHCALIGGVRRKRANPLAPGGSRSMDQSVGNPASNIAPGLLAASSWCQVA
jgi:hypothetical protein